MQPLVCCVRVENYHISFCFKLLHFVLQHTYFSFRRINIRLLNSWLKKYESSQEIVSLCSEPESVEDMANRSKDSYKEENAQLKKRIKDLEKALDYSKLETLARDILIDKAEEYFDISIRKKSGAKQR